MNIRAFWNVKLYQLSTVFLLQPFSSPVQQLIDQASLVGVEGILSVPLLLGMRIDSITLTALSHVWVCVIFAANCDVINVGTCITRKRIFL